MALDATQAFNRMQGAAFVTFSDDASRDLAETGLVRAYPDSPRITMVSSVISPTAVITQPAQLQIMDLVHDSIRAIAYPGQAKGAEPTYRLTRGMNEAFLEKMVGEQMTGQTGKSAAGVLQAASAQNIPLVYVDAEHLESLAQSQISLQAKARIVDAVMQGYGVLVPERMATWDGQSAIAWWLLDLKTGEVVDVNEDGTHQFLVIFTAEAKVLIAVALIAAVLIARIVTWHWAVTSTWTYFWQTTARLQRSGMRGDALYLASLAETKKHMKSIRPWLPLLW